MDAEWEWQKCVIEKFKQKIKLKKEGKIMVYGEFGGQYVPQNLREKLNEIEREFTKIREDDDFKNEYLYYLNH